MKSTTFAFIVAAFCTAAHAAAQDVFVTTDTPSLATTRIHLPSSISPNVTVAGSYTPPNFASILNRQPPSVYGGECVNAYNGFYYRTDGITLAIEQDPNYTNAVAIPTPQVIQGIVFPGQQITGLAFVPNASAVGGILMSTTSGFGLRAPTFPFSQLAPSVTCGFVTSLITGIDYDPAGNSVWLCDAAGKVYQCNLSGVPIGAQPVATVTMPGTATIPALTGIKVNRTVGFGSFPPPACSTQVGGWRIIVTNGIWLKDALTPATPAVATGRTTISYDLAYAADMQPLAGSASPAATATLELNRPAHNGTASPALNILLKNASPLQQAIFCYDLCPTTSPVNVPWGGQIHLNPATLFYLTTTTSNPFGTAQVTVPSGALPGVQFSCLWVYGDPQNPPYNLSHTNVAEITISR